MKTLTAEHIAADLEAITWHAGALDVTPDSDIATALHNPDLLSLAIGHAVQHLTVTCDRAVLYPYPRYCSDGDNRRH